MVDNLLQTDLPISEKNKQNINSYIPNYMCTECLNTETGWSIRAKAYNPIDPKQNLSRNETLFGGFNTSITGF